MHSTPHRTNVILHLLGIQLKEWTWGWVGGGGRGYIHMRGCICEELQQKELCIEQPLAIIDLQGISITWSQFALDGTSSSSKVVGCKHAL